MSRLQCLMLTLLGCVAMAQAALAQPADAQPAGAKIYGKWCSDCHSTPTGPGSIALERKYHGNPPAILLERTDLSPDTVKVAVRNGISFMPSFRKTEISDAELAQLGAYLTAPPGRRRSARRP